MLVGIITKNWLRSLVKGDDDARGEPDLEFEQEVRVAASSEDDELSGSEVEPAVEASSDSAEDPDDLAQGDEEEEQESEEAEEDSVAASDAEQSASAIDDPLAPAYDLEDGELFDEDDFLEEQKPKLPWSSRVQSAKDFFATEILYRFDILEMDMRRTLAGNYRFEIKGYQGGVWTLGVGEELSVVNRREEADIVLTMYQRDFLQLVNGELNPQLAILAQKLRVQGDIRKAMAFQDIILPQRDN